MVCYSQLGVVVKGEQVYTLRSYLKQLQLSA
jgi:hypothetical protein